MEEYMEFSRLVRERHSVRKFTEEPVSKEQLLRLLEETRLAPTAVNHQPQRYLVITEKAGMEKLSRCTKYTFGAPCAIVVCCNRDEAWVNRYTGEMKGEVDAAIAATHLMLAIHDAGLGSCWVGSFDPKVLTEEFGLPENIFPVAIFPIGHIAPDSEPAKKHFERKSLDEVTVWEHF